MESLKGNKIKIFKVFSVFGIILFLSGSIYAIVQLAVVPQNIGLKDVEFKQLNRKYCEECHGESLADRHHKTKNAVSGNCTACHDVKNGNVTQVIRKTNCLDCHTKSPHHATQEALNKECTSCHESPGLSDYSMNVPKYNPTMITPTKETCKKCHRDGVVNGKKVYGFKKTHHGISYKDCNVCHSDNKASQDIRICERCHSVKAIHEVKPHVEKTNCIHCHDTKEGVKYEKMKK